MSTSNDAKKSESKFITPVNKAIVTAVAGVLDIVVASMADNVIDLSEKQHVVTTLITFALGVWAVWRVPNKDNGDA